MEAALDIAGLLELLDAGQTVLVPAQHAARALRDRFDGRQRSRGLLAWEPPAVLTWTEWTSSLWSAVTITGRDDRVLLNRLQEEALWTEIIAAAPRPPHAAAGPLRDLTRLARTALELAAAHLPAEQLQRRLEHSADGFDSRSFAEWYRALAARCHSARLLPRALLEDALAPHAAARSLSLPATLHLAGFDRLTPAQTGLLDALRSAGCLVHSHSLAQPRGANALSAAIQAGSPQDQLLWAARWIRQRFEQHPTPELGFALILPDPAGERPSLDPLLREILAPELERVDADLSSTPWHFSSGPPLSRLPLIQHALLLLRWLETDLPLEDIGRILLSPFFAHAAPLEARAGFEMHTLRRRELLRPELSLEALLRLADRARAQDEPVHLFPELHRVRDFLGSSGSLTGTGSHADWTELTRKVLRLAGWPGSRTLSAAEFRATEAWEGLLDLLATLDLHGGRLKFSEFLDLLRRQAEMVPAPEPTETALIQIARLADIEGCLFDATLVLHATDQALPPPEHTHPLLGWSLQHSLGLPGTDPVLTHSRARDTLRSLRDRSGTLLLLAAAEDENGPLRLTPLAAELGCADRSAADLLPAAPEPAPLPPLLAPDTIPLPPLPGPHVRGGARVLELQAACGFRAFASLRLHADAPESRTLGLDARENGKLLHRVMELLWSDLKSRQNLRALSTPARRAAVERAVSAAFEPLHARNREAGSWNDAYLGTLEERLTNLILRWLPLELERGDFTVLPPEQQQTVHVGPLDLSVRLDRIDQVEDGFVFIDYKTAFDLSPKHWLGERPDAPQLPLYATLAETGEVRALAFARIRPGKDMAWLSLEDRPGVFPQKKRRSLHDLGAEMELWRAELDRLAHAFAAGDAEVDPKSFPKTCQHCEHRLLCRLDSVTLLAAAGSDPDPEALRG